MRLFRLDLLLIIFCFLSFQGLDISHDLSHKFEDHHQEQKHQQECSICLSHFNNESIANDKTNSNFLKYSFYYNIAYFNNIIFKDIYLYSKSRSPPILFS
ncbi:hypothetical protein N8772_03940 [Rickettsiales bacterium]|nr:hypothetical protein [Rickettsiales bacterium]